MNTIAIPQRAESQPSGRGGVRLAVAIVLGVWLRSCCHFVPRVCSSALREHHPWPLRLELQRRSRCFSRGCGSRRPSASSCSQRICGNRWNPGLAMGRSGLPHALCIRGAPGSIRSTGWPRRHGHRAHGPVDHSLPGTAAGLRGPWQLRPLEYPGDIGPRHRNQHRSRECLLHDGDPRRDQHRSDGDTAIAADPGIPRTVVPDAAHRRADAEPAIDPWARIVERNTGSCPAWGQLRHRVRILGRDGIEPSTSGLRARIVRHSKPLTSSRHKYLDASGRAIWCCFAAASVPTVCQKFGQHIGAIGGLRDSKSRAKVASSRRRLASKRTRKVANSVRSTSRRRSLPGVLDRGPLVITRPGTGIPRIRANEALVISTGRLSVDADADAPFEPSASTQN